MACSSNINNLTSNNSTSCNQCVDEFNCGSTCPDFQIKQHDTKPAFKVAISTCDGPVDLTGLVLEASMWANAKFKAAVADTDNYFALADNIGFQQALVGDIIVVGAIRNPEQMLITGFDETLKLIQVLRGYNGTPVTSYKKGCQFKIFRVLNAVAQTELTYEDELQIDGTVAKNTLVRSELVYEWSPNDTCVPGCYNFEFKLLHMINTVNTLNAMSLPSVPSFISFTPSQYGCFSGTGVDWVRRFPTDGSFLIKISPSPTSELLT